MPSGDSELLAISRELLAESGLEVTSCDIVQRLWQGESGKQQPSGQHVEQHGLYSICVLTISGYGYVCRLEATSESQGNLSLIMKYVKPPPTGNVESEGHIRKVVSYEVEQYFYAKLAPSLPSDIPVAQCYASINDGGKVALILQDLRDIFPFPGEKRATLNATQVYAAIRWLAGFHGFWQGRIDELRQHRMRLPPLQEVQKADNSVTENGIWLNGGYTYLATRADEFERLCHDEASEWSAALCRTVPTFKKSTAEQVAQVLSPAIDSKRPGLGGHETLIHGDVKSENLFTTQSGDAVAFFDFQYVGLGCGLSDLAKLFTCSVPVDMLHDARSTSRSVLEMGQGEADLLEYYRTAIEQVSSKPYPSDIFIMHWQTALIDWLRFQASWGFWGNTEWLEARGRSILQDKEWLKWLAHAST